MAYTSIHSIKATDWAALDYITRSDKTINGLYVQSYSCRADSIGAAADFRAVRAGGTERTQILAHHIVQSFAPDEVTPEQALQIGEELCDRFLQGNYQYVLAVHTDKSHTHCHIIFNNTNLYNGLSFTYEHNQGKVKDRSWAQLRAISDELCKEHGISVIEPKAKGVSHFERDMQLQGKSWKDKLRAKIAEVAFYSKDFADFLRNCSASGIEYVYKPQNKVKLKFRLSGEGQQKFTRAETLGEDYTAERIAEQIEQIQKAKSAMERLAEKKNPEKAVAPPKPTVTPKTEPTPTVTAPTKPTKSKGLTSEEFFALLDERSAEITPAPKPTTVANEPESNLSVMTEEEYIKILNEQDRQAQAEKKATPPADPWAEIRGMGRANEIIADLESGGVTSYHVLASFFYKGGHPDDHTDELAELKKKYTAIDTLIAKMKHRDELAPVYKEYQGKSGWFQSRFKKKNAAAIEDYEETAKYIKEHRQPYLVDGKPPTMLDLLEKSNKLKSKYNSLLPEHTAFVTKRDTAKKYVRQVRNYMNEEHNRREREKYRQKKLTQQKNKNYLE
ncbi:Relaxase/mobilization nuclease family protein [Ruminococcus albus 7 = DSM 20455]|uniref:Relaxase/mobilization nuclease family protein n=1 Tax=Ruminococcus albus (strain ATCC 27210 / DSM 20455 / JCM 14654 / NCDO 2250 / 7) TaxID=697329 RepID=E6UGE0_RUMA7|nr:Relaxase/mobilization nuclease family protein [Ruminococcus albus 7 = DSM 20455]